MERLKQKSRNLFRPFILSIFTKILFCTLQGIHCVFGPHIDATFYWFVGGDADLLTCAWM